MSFDESPAAILSTGAWDEPTPTRRAWACACGVCKTAADGASAYFAMAWLDPGHARASGEQIADTLGYCARHGAQLMADDALLQATAPVLKHALPRMLALLEPQRFGEEKFQSVYFAAPRACPACAYERRVVGRHAARLARRQVEVVPAGDTAGAEPLCVLHFQTCARGLKPEHRMPALAHYAQALDSIERALREAPAAGDQVWLDRALAAVGRPADASSLKPQPWPGATADDGSRLGTALGGTTACAVCLQVEQAQRRWLTAVPLAATHQLEGWLFFPTCAEHVSAVAGQGDAAATAAVCAHALQVASTQLRQQLRVLVRAAESEAELAAARIARWGRRPRRKKTDPPAQLPPRVVRCAACERLAIAELNATVKLLRLLRSDRHRQAFESGFGLCMKHHAQAYLLAPQGPVRTLIRQDQRARLSALLAALQQGFGTDEYRVALRRFGGLG